MCVYTVDIEGLLGFIFRRGHNKFHLGLYIIVYLVLHGLPFDSRHYHFQRFDKIYFLIDIPKMLGYKDFKFEIYWRQIRY